MATKTVTDQSFASDVLGSDGPVLVDFWAEWCGPCRMVSPALEEIASEHEGRITVAKLNVDENPEVVRRYGVMSIPTIALFVDGDVKAQVIGARAKDDIIQRLGLSA